MLVLILHTLKGMEAWFNPWPDWVRSGYWIIKIETDSLIQTDHIIEIKVNIGTIRILETGTTLEVIGIEVNILQVIGETWRTERGHVIEVDAGIDIIEEDPVGTEETAHLGMEEDPHLGIKVKTEDVIFIGSQDILYGSVRKRNEIKVKKDRLHKCNK